MLKNLVNRKQLMSPPGPVCFVLSCVRIKVVALLCAAAEGVKQEALALDKQLSQALWVALSSGNCIFPECTTEDIPS